MTRLKTIQGPREIRIRELGVTYYIDLFLYLYFSLWILYTCKQVKVVVQSLRIPLLIMFSCLRVPGWEDQWWSKAGGHGTRQETAHQEWEESKRANVDANSTSRVHFLSSDDLRISALELILDYDVWFQWKPERVVTDHCNQRRKVLSLMAINLRL
jgi:hypothetical protein